MREVPLYRGEGGRTLGRLANSNRVVHVITHHIDGVPTKWGIQAGKHMSLPGVLSPAGRALPESGDIFQEFVPESFKWTDDRSRPCTKFEPESFGWSD